MVIVFGVVDLQINKITSIKKNIFFLLVKQSPKYLCIKHHVSQKILFAFHCKENGEK